jgi:hypothetical protein
MDTALVRRKSWCVLDRGANTAMCKTSCKAQKLPRVSDPEGKQNQNLDAGTVHESKPHESPHLRVLLRNPALFVTTNELL